MIVRVPWDQSQIGRPLDARFQREVVDVLNHVRATLQTEASGTEIRVELPVGDDLETAMVRAALEAALASLRLLAREKGLTLTLTRD